MKDSSGSTRIIRPLLLALGAIVLNLVVDGLLPGIHDVAATVPHGLAQTAVTISPVVGAARVPYGGVGTATPYDHCP